MARRCDHISDQALAHICKRIHFAALAAFRRKTVTGPTTQGVSQPKCLETHVFRGTEVTRHFSLLPAIEEGVPATQCCGHTWGSPTSCRARMDSGSWALGKLRCWMPGTARRRRCGPCGVRSRGWACCPSPLYGAARRQRGTRNSCGSSGWSQWTLSTKRPRVVHRRRIDIVLPGTLDPVRGTPATGSLRFASAETTPAYAKMRTDCVNIKF